MEGTSEWRIAASESFSFALMLRASQWGPGLAVGKQTGPAVQGAKHASHLYIQSCQSALHFAATRLADYDGRQGTVNKA